MRKVDDMEELTNFYEKMMKHFADLSGTGKMIRHERLVFDLQIVAGKKNVPFNIECKNLS